MSITTPAQLRAAIEALVPYPPLYSHAGASPRGAFFAVLSGGEAPDIGDALLRYATLFRRAVPDNAYLIWRQEPVAKNGEWVMRLCFEAVDPRDAADVPPPSPEQRAAMSAEVDRFDSMCGVQ